MAVSARIDRTREPLQRKRDLESKIKEDFGQIDQAMRSTVAQAKVAVAVLMEELTLKEDVFTISPGTGEW
ncbi:unnamed protein product [Zymoseptoria tritici ST99CH_1A5]|uniref:Uncharacterized protein n=1 Tax=Zymoseptoria tritici ST99CH_1A5 TaxID=1276529 RepID=A0A1Y6M191_ZYMTR|nr:unnamed protein product [Zymoseptoria tritici ST99CH_1A5]